MACCVKDCTFTVNGSAVNIYGFTITDEGQQEINVSTFESVVDAWLSCGQAGSITFNSFRDLNIERGDTGIAYSANVCGDAYTGNCTCTSFTLGPIDRTAGDTPRMTYVARLESITYPS